MGSNGHKPFNRSEFLQGRLRTRDLDIAGFGRVRLQEMSAWEKGQWDSEIRASQESPNPASSERTSWQLRTVARHLIDEEGNKLFTLDPADLQELGTVAPNVIDTIVGECIKFYGPEAVEEAEKNSPDPSAVSATA